MMTEARDFWNEQAASFDEEPDHGLLDPVVRSAWANLLLPLLPPPGSKVVDLGCGTGSLSVLLAESGYLVRGLDFSPQMVELARHKAADAGVRVTFEQGDAGEPPYQPGECDVVLVRHVLWAMPDKNAAVERWSRLLSPHGILVLVEGRWWTGGGLGADECEAIVRTARQHTAVTMLDDPALWGREIDDERYLLVSTS